MMSEIREYYKGLTIEELVKELDKYSISLRESRNSETVSEFDTGTCQYYLRHAKREYFNRTGEEYKHMESRE
jgi:hypothetical protein